MINPGDAVLTINNKIINKDRIFESNKNKISLICKRRGHVSFQKTYNKILPFGEKTIIIDLQKEIYDIEINMIDETSDIILKDGSIEKMPYKARLEYGSHNFTLTKKRYKDINIVLNAVRDGLYLFRYSKSNNPYKEVGIFDCGEQPKQVIFSPDNNFIYIILLDGMGYQVFDIDNLIIKEYIKAPDKKMNRGFPEGLFINEKKVFWISQMTTGKIYEYSYPENKYVRTIETKGVWSKYMAWNKNKEIAAVSNWLSNNVSIINYTSGKVMTIINTAKAPRGVIFSNDGAYLYVTSFEGGMIQKFSTDNWKELKNIHKKNAAMRHIVISNNDKEIYVSNMYHNEIYVINTKDFCIKKSYKVFSNPNTLEITPDNKYLFVSCRGPNDVKTYLARSPKNGKIVVIDLEKKEITSTIDGGNQPTGLDISGNGRYLCFSNFRDNNFEIYKIKD